MDLVELSRKRAKELHFQTASAGHDPWKPYDFAVAAAEVESLSVERCASGSNVLDGARAIFIPSDEHIFHENTGTPFDQAFLVAHEIGHALLGDGESEDSNNPVEIDATRSAESSPVGMDRVVDYSNRQRREVQMDLFAREFLLPREWVKKLHLDNGMTCTEIATKIGAPFEVVAQQLLDALLLPIIDIEDSTPPPDIPLNSKQGEAATHRGNAFLLQAGPGTGKTRTLVARVESLIDEGVDPRRVLLLTFSNKAAAEMADRIALKRPHEATSLWIGTFHGFGLDILRRFNDKCGLPANPRLLDRVEAVDFIEDEILRLGLKHYRNLFDPSEVVADMISAISRAKDEVVDAVSYLSLAQEMLSKASNSEEVDAAEKAIEVANVYRFYEQAKLERGSVDFGDLVMLPVLLLEQNESVRLTLQQSYDHVLVDEYQDVNRSSIRLLNALKPDGNNLWVVGDAKQSIYRFRGASSFNMSRFGNQDFPGGITENLEINYRSTPEIVNAYSKFAQKMGATGTSNKALSAERASIGFPPEIRTVANGSLVGSAIADSILEHLSAGYAYRDQAVLTRGNTNLSKLSRELESLGIPVLFLGSLFERPEIRDLIALLSILVDKRAMGLLRTAHWSQFEMQMEDIVLTLDHLRQSESKPRAWMSIDIPGMSEQGRLSLIKLSEALIGFDDHSNPWQVLAHVLLDRTSVAAAISRSDTVIEQAKGIAIWQFMNFLRVQPNGKGLPIPRLIDRMRRLVRLRDERDLRQLPIAAQSLDAVRLMTIHGSKGLEFPVVHLAGCNPGSIPTYFRSPRCLPPEGMIAGTEDLASSVEKAAHNEEEECLFYVAASRAKNHLLFYGATADVNGKKRQLSPYLTRLGGILESEIIPKLSLAVPDQSPILVSFSGTPTFGSEALSLYEKCGRRFLYTHLLHVGGRRRMTAFTSMHEAVREVYKLVVETGSSVNHNCEVLLESAFGKAGLLDHGYVEDYRAIGKTMLQYFITSRAGASYQQPTALQVSFGNCHIEVRPDDILIRDGQCTLRRVRTGHFRKDDLEDLNATAFIIAAQNHFPNATIELVYLADENATTLTLSGTKLISRYSKIAKFVSEINSGLFEANQNEFTCPNCSAYFICGPTPSGTLIKHFQK